MSFHPLERRYGHGAARLPIGVPTSSIRLSQVARTPTPLERSFALAPGLLCVAVAMLLAAATVFQSATGPPTLASSEPTTIELWSEAQPLSPVEPVEPAPLPTVAEIAPAVPLPIPDALPEPTPPEASRPFDVGLLAMAPTHGVPDAIDAPVEPRPRNVASMRPGFEAGKSDIALDEIARSVPEARAFEASTADLALGIASTPARPGIRPSGAKNTRAPVETRVGPAKVSRDSFLAELGGSAVPASTFAGEPGREERPHVAAAAASRAIGQEVRDRISRQARVDGWHEVPLDELPDCSPPGRQDGLKKRILLAAAQTSERECLHREGHYRFLETRNLNAFLMWSRPNPDSGFQPEPARDVCDVLERALRCLSVESMEKIGARR